MKYKVALDSLEGEILLFRSDEEDLAAEFMINFYNDTLCASVEFYPIHPLGEARVRYIRKDFIYEMSLTEEIEEQ